ncbi:MAG: hypothetical protein ABEI77_04770 [Halorientalis sp.]
MSDDTAREPPTDDARMDLTQDTVHESEDGYYLDCPECGSPVSIGRIVEIGRCSGTLDPDVTEVDAADQQLKEPECTAELTLQLIWES